MDTPICYCFGVSEGKIRQVIREHRLHSVEDVTDHCHAGAGCHGCWIEIEEILEDMQDEVAALEAADAGKSG